MNKCFWEGKKLFLTGHTGFKGGWTAMVLKSLGAKVFGYALAPEETSFCSVLSVPNLLEKSEIGDVRHLQQLKNSIVESAPDIIVHMAAQPLVRASYADPIATFETNVMGTINVLEAARNVPSVKAILVITTDKVYENNEWYWGYRENEALGGHDPYSSSKACAELACSSYRKSFFESSHIGLATARAGNVIGGGDWSKDRIIPDIMRAIKLGNTLHIRNPTAIRPWQHVLEPVFGYLDLCQKLFQDPSLFAQAWNFGPRESDAQPVSQIVELINVEWDNALRILIDKNPQVHEAHFLKLDCAKANNQLGWRSIWTIYEAIKETANWYKSWMEGKDMLEVTNAQIQKYMSQYFETNEPI